MSTSNPTCKTCRHRYLTTSERILFPIAWVLSKMGKQRMDEWYRCRRTLETIHETDFFTNKKIVVKNRARTCALERVLYRGEHCGEEGRYWQPRNPKLLTIHLLKTKSTD